MLAHPWLFPLLAALPAAILVLVRRRARPLAVPLADAASLAGPARRTALVRTGLAAVLVALLAVSATLVRRPDEPIANLLASGKSTIIVIDFSASVQDFVYPEIARTLQRIVNTAGDSRRIGLVLFSDVAEEALPPGTRVEELRPFIRFFLPKLERGERMRPQVYRVAGPGGLPPPIYPLSPWYRRFSAGTRISSGLAVARQALERDGVRGGRVLLLSDLAESGDDLPRLTTELTTYARRGIDLDVVALPPAYEAQERLFRRILGERLSIVESDALAGRGAATGGPGRSFPHWLVTLVALVGLALAVNELVGAPLSWRRSVGEAAG